MAYRRKSKTTSYRKAPARRTYAKKRSTKRAAPRAQVIKIQFSHVPMQQQSIPLMGQDGQLVQLAPPQKKGSKL